jgi:hypothetical protein
VEVIETVSGVAIRITLAVVGSLAAVSRLRTVLPGILGVVRETQTFSSVISTLFVETLQITLAVPAQLLTVIVLASDYFAEIPSESFSAVADHHTGALVHTLPSVLAHLIGRAAVDRLGYVVLALRSRILRGTAARVSSEIVNTRSSVQTERGGATQTFVDIFSASVATPTVGTDAHLLHFTVVLSHETNFRGVRVASGLKQAEVR